VFGESSGAQLTGDWKVWPQIWQDREPMPSFLSILTVTEFSWLQKRQEKMMGSEEPFFLGAGFLVAFLRLPCRCGQEVLVK
jgi:hypothetical protein